MNDNLPGALKILVERVVRPLPLPVSRQRRLRTEFLEHLQTIHAEELTRDGDPAAALTRTQERFGDPLELTAELRSTIRWGERWEYRLQLWFEQQARESSMKYALRMMTLFVAFLLISLGLVSAVDHLIGVERISMHKLQVIIAVLVFLVIWMGSVLTFGLQMGVEWERSSRRWVRIAGCCCGMFAAWPLSLAVLMGVAGGSWSDYSMPLAGSIIGGLMTVVMGTVFGVFHRRDTVYRCEWAALDIEAA